MKALGFPNVDPKHLLLRTGSSDKQECRNMVEKDYEVALLMGDNHNDFHSAFRNKSVVSDLPKPTGSRIPGGQNSSSCPTQPTVTGRVQSMKETGGLLLLKRTK
ncbi:MAG: hypothetical protein VX003_14390 [SAR324 cluster bacterium]|nr:hypothetical protein [SAR324 cluster bacterium]